MSNLYEKKQVCRKKEANSSTGIQKHNDRQRKKRSNKIKELIHNDIIDYHPDSSSYERSYSRSLSYKRELSIISDVNTDDDDDNTIYVSESNESKPRTIDLSIEEIHNINQLANHLPKDVKVLATPFKSRYSCWSKLNTDTCRSTVPKGDEYIYHDFKAIFKNESTEQLITIINSLQIFPYYEYYKEDGKIFPKNKKKIQPFQLTQEQLLLCYDIHKEILTRASYGILFLYKNTFFAITNSFGKQKKGAIKSRQILKSDGQWESPWDTAVRKVKEEIEYFSIKNQTWHSYDINKNEKEWQFLNYLEHPFSNNKKNDFIRMIGLFVIRLKKSIQFRPKQDTNEILNCNWYPIEDSYDTPEYFTLRPFIQYVKTNYSK